MKYILGCLCSAILGAFFVLALNDSTIPIRQARAQDGFPPLRGPSFPIESRGAATSVGGVVGQSDDFLEDLTEEERVNVRVYENVNRSVVNITTRTLKTEGLFSLDVVGEGTGSGSILDRNGHILTNYHVVEDARQINVMLDNGKSFEAVLIGADPINDVAVLKIDAPPEMLHPVVLGDSNRLRVGMKVYAIGNPFGLERTLTTGVISSLNRSLQIHGNRTIKSIIQIDAAINPGNSGGPLLDTNSRLIGMNTAIATKTGQSSGVGFAIPVNLITRIVPQLIAQGRVIRPEIGISQVYQTDAGLLIAQLVPEGPAAKAGLRGPSITRKRRGPFVIERVDRSAADLIIKADGKEIKTADDFLGIIESKQPGDQISLTIRREGREIPMIVRLGRGDQPAAGIPVPNR